MRTPSLQSKEERKPVGFVFKQFTQQRYKRVQAPFSRLGKHVVIYLLSVIEFGHFSTAPSHKAA